MKFLLIKINGFIVAVFGVGECAIECRELIFDL